MGRALVLHGHLPNCCHHFAGHPHLQLVGSLKENTQGRSQFFVLPHSPSQRWTWSKGRLAGQLAEYCLAGSCVQLGDSGSEHCLARVGEGGSLLLLYPPPGICMRQVNDQNCLWPGISLVLQWPGLCSQCRGLGSIPESGIRSLMPRLKILHTARRLKIWCATAKTWHSQINK